MIPSTTADPASTTFPAAPAATASLSVSKPPSAHPASATSSAAPARSFKSTTHGSAPAPDEKSQEMPPARMRPKPKRVAFSEPSPSHKAQPHSLAREEHEKRKVRVERRLGLKGMFIEYTRSKPQGLECDWNEDSELGRGSNGTVYWGRWTNANGMQRERAIKRYTNECTLRGWRFEACFYREIDLWSKHFNNDPNIVRFIAAGRGTTNRGKSYFFTVMEYCEHTLYSWIHGEADRHALTRQQTLDIILGTARGLGKLHNATPSCTHRDLKSLNILLMQESSDSLRLVPKICDLGELKDTDSLITGTATSKDQTGTKLWNAPEVTLGGLRNATQSSDVYALSIVYFEVVTGKLPNADYDFNQYNCEYDKAVQEYGHRPPMPENSPPWSEQLIGEMWAQDPDKRPTTTSIIRRIEAEARKDDSLIINVTNSDNVNIQVAHHVTGNVTQQKGNMNCVVM